MSSLFPLLPCWFLPTVSTVILIWSHESLKLNYQKNNNKIKLNYLLYCDKISNDWPFCLPFFFDIPITINIILLHFIGTQLTSLKIKQEVFIEGLFRTGLYTYRNIYWRAITNNIALGTEYTPANKIWDVRHFFLTIFFTHNALLK